jgi:hypothetical protein
VLRVTTYHGPQINCPLSEQEVSVSQDYPWRYCSNILARRSELCYSDSLTSWNRLCLRNWGTLNPRPRGIVTKLMTPFCWTLLSGPLFQCETYCDWFAYFKIRCTGNLRHHLALPCAIFDKCRMLCQTRRSEFEFTCLAGYCNCSSSRTRGHDVVTFDDSWFYFSIDHGLICLLAGAPVRRCASPR